MPSKHADVVVVGGGHNGLVAAADLAKAGKTVPWAEYLTWDQRAFMKAPGNHYSQARYMFIYLHSAGKLSAWYKTYVENFATDRTGALAFEKVFGKPLADIENDWLAWLAKQELPAEPQPAENKDPQQPQPAAQP